MKTKTKSKIFKIGEASYYGIWKAEILSDKVKISGIGWDDKEVKQTEIFDINENLQTDIYLFMSEMSTSYWGDVVSEWVENNIIKE